jgi:hypothetical protein
LRQGALSWLDSISENEYPGPAPFPSRCGGRQRTSPENEGVAAEISRYGLGNRSSRRLRRPTVEDWAAIDRRVTNAGHYSNAVGLY